MRRVDGWGVQVLRLIAVVAVASGLILLAAGTAGAQSLTGGCRATVSGRTLPSMTFEDPLVVTKGKGVRAAASVPASNRRATTNLSLKVGPVSNSYSFKGTRYNRSLTPPEWLFTIADGVVRFSGTATGSGFNCMGSGYVKIEGDGLLSLIGGALLGAGGAAGVAGSSGPKQPPTREELAAKAETDAAREFVKAIRDAARELAKDYGATAALLILLLIFQIFVFGVMS